MVTDDLTAAYAGARVTRLVNRDDILEQIEAAVHDPTGRTFVFHIEAEGGTGKTFLSREMLRRCREGEWARSDLVAAKNELDLYHHQVHSRDRFMDAFVAELGVGTDFFGNYREQSEQIRRLIDPLHGAAKQLEKQRELLTLSFLEGCEELGAKKRIVVALDTVERLYYEIDRVQEALGLDETTFSVRPWLWTDWLPRMPNSVILLCGRRRRRFREELQEAKTNFPQIEFRDDLKLGSFTKKDTQEYFRAVEETAKRDENAKALKRLAAISADSRQVVYHLTEGRPIVLALIIDYYLATARLLEEVKRPLAEIEALSKEDLQAIQERLQADVVRQFRSIGRPADEAIVALAWVPKGMDAELMSRVAGIELEEAQGILQMLAHPTSGLSFVKIRPTDQRTFLHDEMYALLKRFVLDRLPEAHAERAYGEILKYYSEKIAEQQKEIWELLARQQEESQSEEQSSPTPPNSTAAISQALADARALLDDLQVEDVYYRLRHNPLDGFAQYCEYAEAAVSINHASLDVQLSDEMLFFVREVLQEEDEIQGLRRDDVERDSALRWGWRYMYDANPEQAYRVAQYLRGEDAAFIAAGGPLAEAELDILEGWAAAFLGRELEVTEKPLRDAVQTLSQLRPTSEYEHLRRRVLLAQGYNILGYLLRVQGRFRSACETYRHALPLWRELRREADHAETLNNLAWANAEAGNFGQALRRCQDGLKIRESLGYRFLTALSYNTLGQIETKADQPHRGYEHCKLALEMFEELAMPRGVGLASIGLAEAYRRRAETPLVYTTTRKVKLLREAQGFAEQAVAIFRDQVPEGLRLVEALNELGCTCRNWARLGVDYNKPDDPTWDELIEQGIESLEEAARLSAEELSYRQVDALVNLSWLYFYADKPELATETLRRVEKAVPQAYFITQEKGLPDVEDPIAFLWVQLGKARLLQGEMTLKQYTEAGRKPGEVREETLWQQVAEHFTMALAYNELFADDFRDMRRAKDTMYDALRDINTQELAALFKGVDSTAGAYQMKIRSRKPGELARPRMRNFLEENFGTMEGTEEDPA